MKNTSATTRLNNASSSSTEDLPSKAEGMAWCSAFALEAVLIVLGNLLTIVLFAVDKKLHKKSLFLVINMAFADLMIGTVSLPLRTYLVYARSYQPWTAKPHTSLFIFYVIMENISLLSSLISAASISGERFCAIYWPLQHRTLSGRAYRMFIPMEWTLAILFATVVGAITAFNRISLYTLFSCFLILLFIVFGCNIGIWRKFQHGSIASHQQNRASQSQRLTKTLLFVSILALLSWLPVITAYCLVLIFDISPVPVHIEETVRLLLYSNAFLNPIVYALRIPEF